MLKQAPLSTECSCGSHLAAERRKQSRWLMPRANNVVVFCSQMWRDHLPTDCPAASPPTPRWQHGRGNTASWPTASWCCSTGRRRCLPKGSRSRRMRPAGAACAAPSASLPRASSPSTRQRGPPSSVRETSATATRNRAAEPRAPGGQCLPEQRPAGYQRRGWRPWVNASSKVPAQHLGLSKHQWDGWGMLGERGCRCAPGAWWLRF